MFESYFETLRKERIYAMKAQCQKLFFLLRVAAKRAKAAILTRLRMKLTDWLLVCRFLSYPSFSLFISIHHRFTLHFDFITTDISVCHARRVQFFTSIRREMKKKPHMWETKARKHEREKEQIVVNNSCFAFAFNRRQLIVFLFNERNNIFDFILSSRPFYSWVVKNCRWNFLVSRSRTSNWITSPEKSNFERN